LKEEERWPQASTPGFMTDRHPLFDAVFIYLLIENASLIRAK